MTRGVLAVDLGTSNTYISKCPDSELSPSAVELWGERGSLDTAILYRPGEDPVIGEAATFGWAEASPLQRKRWELHSRFKPEFDRSADVKKWAVDFLKGLLSGGRKRHLDIDPEGRQVFFGFPCQASESWRGELRDVARSAGFGEITLLEEPLAALAEALAAGALSPSEVRRNVLVVDFGGGTCDMASVCGLQVKKAWGDWLLGGRLFDDLFFSLLAERTEGAFERWEAGGAFEFVRLYWSKILKERFSAAMADDRTRRWSGSAGEYGAIPSLDWDEFIGRCRRFTASGPLVGDVPGCPGSAGECDLIGRFEALLDGADEPELVLLSGGSSQWPFVDDAVRVRFPSARVLRSDRPGGAVARGLSLLPALTARHESSRRQLTAGSAAFVSRTLRGPLAQVRQEASHQLGASLSGLMIREAVRPAVEEYRTEGGPLAELEKKLNDRVEGLRGQADEMAHAALGRWTGEAANVLSLLLKEWFAENGVVSSPRLDKPIDLGGAGAGAGLQSLAGKLVQQALSPLSKFGTLAVSALGALLGGTAAALSTAVGPAGWAVGGLLALGGCLAGRPAMERWMSSLDLPKAAAGYLLSEARVNRIIGRLREQAAGEIDQKLSDAWAAGLDEFETLVKQAVASEIAGLDAFCQLGRREETTK